MSSNKFKQWFYFCLCMGKIGIRTQYKDKQPLFLDNALNWDLFDS